MICDARIRDIPAGPVDFYFPHPGNRLPAAWAVPAGSRAGPWALVQTLYFHADWYTLDASGTGPGDWLFETEGVGPTKAGLLDSQVTCHKAGAQYIEDEDAWCWVDFMNEILFVSTGN